eukprot:1196009-Prorocentrum_minimum.AAC.6
MLDALARFGLVWRLPTRLSSEHSLSRRIQLIDSAIRDSRKRTLRSSRKKRKIPKKVEESLQQRRRPSVIERISKVVEDEACRRKNPQSNASVIRSRSSTRRPS